MDIFGEIKTGKEIKGFVWMSKPEYLNKKYPLVNTTRDEIIPDLIKKGHF